MLTAQTKKIQKGTQRKREHNRLKAMLTKLLRSHPIRMPETENNKQKTPNDSMAAKTDNFQSPDYFNVDELLTDEHRLIRESVRSYVKKEISPIIEDYAQRAEFPQQIIKQLGDLGCFGPTVTRTIWRGRT
jgi:hypothetical protein